MNRNFRTKPTRREATKDAKEMARALNIANATLAEIHRASGSVKKGRWLKLVAPHAHKILNLIENGTKKFTEPPE